MFVVTNSFCSFGVWCDQVYCIREEAEEELEKINKQARRGLRPFAEIIDTSKVKYGLQY